MKCLTAVKLAAITSLGISTCGSAFSSVKINSLKTESSQLISSTVRRVFGLASFASAPLAAIASTLFTLAYTRAPARAKHPYLIYAAVGGWLSVATLGYFLGPTACSFSKECHKSCSAKKQRKAAPKPVVKEEVASSLDDSIYVDLKDDKEHSIAEQPAEETLEKEVDEAIAKAQLSEKLPAIKKGLVSSAAVGLVTIMLSTVGFLGDRS